MQAGRAGKRDIMTWLSARQTNRSVAAGSEGLIQWIPQLPEFFHSIRDYGIALLSVSVALGGALLVETFHFRGVEVPFFLFAVALSAWYGGTGPAALALLLSTASFDFFFTVPLHTLYLTASDLPYFVVFAAFASLVTRFSTVRRRVETDLRQTRDELQVEVAERTQQASLLNLTHDTIFVRDMSDVITYWNRGAQFVFSNGPAAVG